MSSQRNVQLFSKFLPIDCFNIHNSDHLYDTELVEKGGTLLAVLDAFQDNERSQLAIDSDDEKDKEIEKFLVRFFVTFVWFQVFTSQNSSTESLSLSFEIYF